MVQYKFGDLETTKSTLFQGWDSIVTEANTENQLNLYILSMVFAQYYRQKKHFWYRFSSFECLLELLQ